MLTILVFLLTAKDRGKTVVAVRFLKEFEPNTIQIKRKTQNRKQK